MLPGPGPAARCADARHGIEEEHMTVERYSFSGVGELVRSGEITDAKTIVGLLAGSGGDLVGANGARRRQTGASAVPGPTWP